jgi:uncharacterized membrane protein YccC
MQRLASIRGRLVDDAGMTTAEYAVGTVAAVGFGGLLVKLLTSPEAQQLLWAIIQKAFSWLF